MKQLIRLDQIPFMLSSSADLFNPIMFMPSDEQKTHEECLDTLLKSWYIVFEDSNSPPGPSLQYPGIPSVKKKLGWPSH